MQAQLQVQVLDVKRFKIESFSQATIYTLGEQIEEDDRVGCPVMKYTGDYEVLASFKGSKFPCMFNLTCTMQQGAKDKTQFHVISASPILTSSHQDKK